MSLGKTHNCALDARLAFVHPAARDLALAETIQTTVAGNARGMWIAFARLPAGGKVRFTDEGPRHGDEIRRPRLENLLQPVDVAVAAGQDHRHLDAQLLRIFEEVGFPFEVADRSNHINGRHAGLFDLGCHSGKSVCVRSTLQAIVAVELGQDGEIASDQFSGFGDDIGDDADAVLQAFSEAVGARIGIGRKKRAEQVSGGVDFHAVETGGFGAPNGLRKLPGHLFDLLSGHRARLSFPGGKRLGRRGDRVGQLAHWRGVGDLRQHLAAVASAVDRVGDPADGGNEAVVIDARLQFVVAATGHGGHVAGNDKPGTALAESAIDREALIGHDAIPAGIFRGSAAYETVPEP